MWAVNISYRITNEGLLKTDVCKEVLMFRSGVM